MKKIILVLSLLFIWSASFCQISEKIGAKSPTDTVKAIGIWSFQNSSNASSNVFTSSPANTTNLSASTQLFAWYMQIGNIVHLMLSVSFNTTAGGSAATVMTFNLPVTTATTTQAFVGVGTIKYSGGAEQAAYAGVASASTGTIKFLSASAVSCNAVIEMTYKIN